MQFQVPQFVEVEEKIIGPLTLKQFFYLAAAFGVSFFSFFVLQIWLWSIVTIVVGSLALAFAFIKYNGRPFSVLIRAIFNYFWKPRLYLWQKTEAAPSGGALSNLELQLKTSTQPIIKREKGIKFSILEKFRTNKERFEILRRLTGEREAARRVDYK